MSRNFLSYIYIIISINFIIMYNAMYAYSHGTDAVGQKIAG